MLAFSGLCDLPLQVYVRVLSLLLIPLSYACVCMLYPDILPGRNGWQVFWNFNSLLIIRMIFIGDDLFNKIELIYFLSFPNILRHAYR
jgi:hypothetical protein